MIPTEDRLPTATGAQVLSELRRIMRGQWFAAALIALVMIGAAAAGLVMPIALGRVVDAVQEGRSTSYLAVIAAAIVAATVVQAVLNGVGIVLSARVFDRLVARLRERLIERALRLPPSVIERAGTGDLLTRAGDDVYNVSDAMSSVLPTFATSVFTIAITAVGLAVIDPRFLLGFAIAIPIQVFAVWSYLRVAPPLFDEAMAVGGHRSNQVIGSFRGARTVIAFRQTEAHLDRIAAATWPVVRYGLLVRIVFNRLFTRLTASELAGLVGLLAVGYRLVGAGQITVGEATTGILLVFRLFQPIRQILLVTDQMQRGLTSLARVVGVLTVPIGGGDEPRRERPPTDAPPAVHVRDVRFAYHRGHPVLDGVDLHISSGEHVALVGASGAGKTTLATLIAGVHRPDSGAILIDGTDIATHDRAALAEDVTLISQETHTFAGPLRDDLTLATPDATDDEIDAALRLVGAADWVGALPGGLECIVGGHARHLTAAQEQQLALARLVLKNPSLVILDEATAAAGSSSARLLERAADAAVSGRTALFVAHRLSQAARSGRVIVMDHGHIVEDGTHEQLLAAGGRYADLWEAWSAHR